VAARLAPFGMEEIGIFMMNSRARISRKTAGGFVAELGLDLIKQTAAAGRNGRQVGGLGPSPLFHGWA